ncbi:MAG: hypothetical protein MK213_00990, partial [Planctomycetes bacterium]|nr:hypothetical protein [Planctomycetota bacterium]
MKPKPFSWTFKPAFGALALLMIWAEVASWLFHGLRDTPGGGRWGFAVGFFFALLPLLSLFVYRGHLVFGFFRSVQVGVSNLILIGLGSIAGVLFHQEDADFRIPVDGVESLVIRQEEDQSTPWTRSERQTYQHYEKFVDAHAYFTYHLLHGVGFHSLPG